jgi:hypothetical protein
MKIFTYAAAIALLTAGTAFAQSSSNSSSMMNNATPTPAMSGPAEGNGGASNQSATAPSNQGMNKSSMDKSSMDQSSMKMNKSAAKKAPKHIASTAKTQHIASKASDRGQNSRENQATEKLNQQQLASGGAIGASNGNPSGNSFNNGAPQQAQAGGANCTPDRPDCGTARQNPAINSSPQQRMYNASPQ